MKSSYVTRQHGKNHIGVAPLKNAYCYGHKVRINIVSVVDSDERIEDAYLSECWWFSLAGGY